MKVQKAKIKRAIEKEANLITGQLVRRACDNPGHCAIGALLFAAGCSDTYIAGLDIAPDAWPVRSKAARVLRDVYGLTRDLAGDIASANDLTYAGQRRRAVLRAIGQLPTRTEY